jgi:uncharacterized protein (TIGR00297 family)
MSKKILIIGSANIDFSMNMYKLPEAGETLIDDGGVAYVPGGKGANAAIAFKRLGADCTFCTKLGADVHGQKLYNYYKEQGLDTSHIKVDHDNPTGLAVVMREGDGTNRIVVYPGANGHITNDNIIEAFECNPDAVYLGFEIPFATVLAVFLDVVVSLTLGNYGFVLLLTFLVGSVLVDKIKKKKQKNDEITKRGDCRDAVQVVANGIIPMFFAIFAALYRHPAFLVGYIAVLSEAFADTVASGFGIFSKKTFDLFKWRPAEKGMSGGISTVGTLSAFFASFLIPALALAFGIVNWALFLIASLAAFLGVFVDSALGSLVQVKYRCISCGKLTEKEWHCNKKCKKSSGFEFFDNDVVNLFSGAFAAIFATAFVLIF